MDVDVFVAAHRAEWDRLTELLRRGARLRGDEADELVALYQRTTTQLSIIQATAPDPVLVGRLSSLVARARAAVTGAPSPAWRELGAFFAAQVWTNNAWVAAPATRPADHVVAGRYRSSARNPASVGRKPHWSR